MPQVGAALKKKPQVQGPRFKLDGAELGPVGQICPTDCLGFLCVCVAVPMAKELNPCHSSDNTTSLTARPPGNSLPVFVMTSKLNFFYILLLLFFVFCLSRAEPEAYGGSQARSLIKAVAAGHSNARSELHLQPTPQLTAHARSLTH